ncbi:MAG: hypothetical protein WCH34_02815 [Bacteroidota bacterium]
MKNFLFTISFIFVLNNIYSQSAKEILKNINDSLRKFNPIYDSIYLNGDSLYLQETGGNFYMVNISDVSKASFDYGLFDDITEVCLECMYNDDCINCYEKYCYPNDKLCLVRYEHSSIKPEGIANNLNSFITSFHSKKNLSSLTENPNYFELSDWLIKLFDFKNFVLYDVLKDNGYTLYTDEITKNFDENNSNNFLNPMDPHWFSDTTKKYILFLAKYKSIVFSLKTCSNSWINKQNVIRLNFNSNSRDYLLLLRKLQSSPLFFEKDAKVEMPNLEEVQSIFISREKTNKTLSKSSKYFFIFEILTTYNEKGIIRNYSVVLCENVE